MDEINNVLHDFSNVLCVLQYALNPSLGQDILNNFHFITALHYII